MAAPHPRARPGRRAVLLGLAVSAAVGTGGCGVDLGELREVRWDDDEPVPTPSPGPDELARRTAATDARRLAEAVARAAPERPALAAVAAEAAAVHAAHLKALAAGSTQEPLDGNAPPGAGGPPGPDELPAAETAAATRALGWLAATSGGMARLLASVAAAETVCAGRLAAALGRPAPEVPTPVTPATLAEPSLVLDDPAADAVSAALAGAHAAVHGFELVAARLADRARDSALAARDAHEQAAEALAGVLRRAGREVPVPEPGYRLPGPATTPAELAALAVLLEERAGALHGQVVAGTGGGPRLLGADLLVGAALRAAAWRGAAVPLPGLG